MICEFCRIEMEMYDRVCINCGKKVEYTPRMTGSEIVCSLPTEILIEDNISTAFETIKQTLINQNNIDNFNCYAQKEKNKLEEKNMFNLQLRKVVYFMFGILEGFFVLRLILKLLGANPGSTLVSYVYDITGVFIAPFNTVFKADLNKDIGKFVIEPTTIVAMIVYAIIAYVIVSLIRIFRTRRAVSDN
jgi:hypothetical protein